MPLYGDYEEKIRELMEKIAKDPSSRAFIDLGNIYLKLEMFDEAIEIIKEGLKYSPENQSALVVLGRSYRKKGNYNEATNIFNRVLKKDNQNLIALLALAEMKRKQGDYEESYRYYDNILFLDPGNEEATTEIRKVKTKLDEINRQRQKQQTKDVDENDEDAVEKTEDNEENIDENESDLDKDQKDFILQHSHNVIDFDNEAEEEEQENEESEEIENKEDKASAEDEENIKQVKDADKDEDEDKDEDKDKDKDKDEEPDDETAETVNEEKPEEEDESEAVETEAEEDISENTNEAEKTKLNSEADEAVTKESVKANKNINIDMPFDSNKGKEVINEEIPDMQEEQEEDHKETHKEASRELREKNIMSFVEEMSPKPRKDEKRDKDLIDTAKMTDSNIDPFIKKETEHEDRIPYELEGSEKFMFYSKEMARVYESQNQFVKALDIYQLLLKQSPGNDELIAKVGKLNEIVAQSEFNEMTLTEEEQAEAKSQADFIERMNDSLVPDKEADDSIPEQDDGVFKEIEKNEDKKTEEKVEIIENIEDKEKEKENENEDKGNSLAGFVSWMNKKDDKKGNGG